MDWLPTIVSAILSALIAASVSWFGVLVNVRQKSVMAARQNWRDELRRLLPQFTAADSAIERERLRDAITLHLNPYKDGNLVENLDAYVTNPSTARRRSVITLFAEYLKYDWQRAKAEAFYRSGRADRIAAEEIDKQRKERDLRIEGQRDDSA